MQYSNFWEGIIRRVNKCRQILSDTEGIEGKGKQKVTEDKAMTGMRRNSRERKRKRNETR